MGSPYASFGPLTLWPASLEGRAGWIVRELGR